MQFPESYTQAWHEFKSFFAMDRIDDIYAVRSRSLAEVDLNLLNALDALLHEHRAAGSRSRGRRLVLPSPGAQPLFRRILIRAG